MKDKVEPKKGQDKLGKDKERDEGEHHEKKQAPAADHQDHGRGEPDFRCGHCGHEFWQKSRPKACPECGRVFG